MDCLDLGVEFNLGSEIEREIINQFIKHLPGHLNHQAMTTYDMIKAEGIERGVEQGAELKEREFIKKLWSFQEFSLEKIALLSGANRNSFSPSACR